MGYFVKNGNPILTDLYFTPLNTQIASKSYRDMYGVVIHANILSMILGSKNDYATLASDLTSYIAAFIIVFFSCYLY